MTVEDHRWNRRPRHARPAGRHALFSDATPADEPERDRATVTAVDPLSAERGILTVACSTCGSVTRVGPIEFLMLQLPVGAWLPRRTFDRWMTCPACRRRTLDQRDAPPVTAAHLLATTSQRRPKPGGITGWLLHFNGTLAYVVVGFLAFAEAALMVGFFIPGETAVVIGGVLAGLGTGQSRT